MGSTVLSKTSEQIQHITSFGVLLFFINFYPISELISKDGMGIYRFSFLFAFPALVILISMFSPLLRRSKIACFLSSIITGIGYGIEGGMGILIIITSYFWYSSPLNDKLEPLFVVLSLAFASAETARRMINKTTINSCKDDE